MGAMAVIAWRRGPARRHAGPGMRESGPEPASAAAGAAPAGTAPGRERAAIRARSTGCRRGPEQGAGREPGLAADAGRGREGRRVRPSGAHRELGALLGAAIAEADDATALALVSTAARKPDVRAEKIVSHRYRFVWICNPKAASRSLIAALRAADPDAVLIRRRTLEQVLAGHPEAGEFFRFAFLRHPYHRTRSFHADKHARALRERDARRWFIEPWHGLHTGMCLAELCRWLDTPCGSDAFADRHWLSQSRQVAAADGRMPDFLGRCERLEADWRAVSERLRLPPVPLPRLNVSDAGRPGEAGLHGDIAALLRRRYAEDFALGGYGDAP